MARRFQNPWSREGKFGYIFDQVLDTSKVLGRVQEPIVAPVLPSQEADSVYLEQGNSLLVITPQDAESYFMPDNNGYNWMVYTVKSTEVNSLPIYEAKIWDYLNKGQKKVTTLALAAHAALNDGASSINLIGKDDDTNKLIIGNLSENQKIFLGYLSRNIKQNGSLVFLTCKSGNAEESALIEVAKLVQRTCYFALAPIKYKVNATEYQGFGFGLPLEEADKDNEICPFERVLKKGDTYIIDKSNNGQRRVFSLTLVDQKGMEPLKLGNPY
jgi:hypothetical protein